MAWRQLSAICENNGFSEIINANQHGENGVMAFSWLKMRKYRNSSALAQYQ
jgi:hypothetical protein